MPMPFLDMVFAGIHTSFYTGTLALRATFRLDSLVKNPHTDPFQTHSRLLGHPSYPNAPKSKSLKLP